MEWLIIEEHLYCFPREEKVEIRTDFCCRYAQLTTESNFLEPDVFHCHLLLLVLTALQHLTGCWQNTLVMLPVNLLDDRCCTRTQTIASDSSFCCVVRLTIYYGLDGVGAKTYDQ